MTGQKVIICNENNAYMEIDNILKEEGIKNPLLVCGNSALGLWAYTYLMNKNITVTRFSDFTPNPSYDSVKEGILTYSYNNCDGIIGIGGGSALDVAKCIKIMAKMSPTVDYLEQEIIPNDIKMIAIPTTAGTGSESTRYSIIYVNGVKYTVTADSSIPEYVFLDGANLYSLSDYQRKSTMLDALSHAIESYWSTKATPESQKYAAEAIELIMDSMKSYLENTPSGNMDMLYAANLAGRAINITGTTAAHAMCYKLTKMFGLAHGHAVAVTLPHLWQYMIDNLDKIESEETRNQIKDNFLEIAAYMGYDSDIKAASALWKLLASLGLPTMVKATEEDIELMTKAVNVDKLKSTPVPIDEAGIKYIYKDIQA